MWECTKYVSFCKTVIRCLGLVCLPSKRHLVHCNSARSCKEPFKAHFQSLLIHHRGNLHPAVWSGLVWRFKQLDSWISGCFTSRKKLNTHWIVHSCKPKRWESYYYQCTTSICQARNTWMQPGTANSSAFNLAEHIVCGSPTMAVATRLHGEIKNNAVGLIGTTDPNDT